ncbi:calcium proton exchanger [Phanerochaete sordida]|uniref:Calcium proton exchanger n=1 Tax=Phanerochaete sordida TaxID=48140 RepID=A0A9P3GLU6_9APHY|nr:calcium proton exchanger [Phanerochaete sordida]
MNSPKDIGHDVPSSETRTSLSKRHFPGDPVYTGSADTSPALNSPDPTDTQRRPRPKSTIGNIAKRMSTVIEENLKPAKPLGPSRAKGVIQGIKAIICMSWLNLLLFCIPVAWALHFIWQNDTTSTQDTIIFVFSFLSIIPLAKLLAFATDELSCRVGQTLAGLLNATLGNAVELIVAIIALAKCELQVVQSSLVGSILSNLLLVLGMCFFAGGTRFSEQGFGVSATQLNSSLLTISVIAVLLPAAFHFAANNTDPTETKDILSVSHGAAIILLFIYGSYLVFQLFSHKDLYSDDNPENFKSTKYAPGKHFPINMHLRRRTTVAAEPKRDDLEMGSVSRSQTRTSNQANGTVLTSQDGHTASADESTAALQHPDPEQAAEEVEEVEEPMLTIPMTIGLLAVVTVIVAVTAEFLVSSIDGLTSTGNISKEFVSLVLLPIVGNAAEHVTAVTVSVKDKIDLSLGVAVGSSIQIALFVIPFIVTLGWIMGKPLSLLFDPYESIVLFLSVLIVNYTVADGRSNWLEGAVLMSLYVMLAVTFWYYPGDSLVSQC